MKEKEYCLKWFMVRFDAPFIVNCNEIPLDFNEIYYFDDFTIPTHLQIWGTVLKQYEYIKGGPKKGQRL